MFNFASPEPTRRVGQKASYGNGFWSPISAKVRSARRERGRKHLKSTFPLRIGNPE